MVTYALTGFGIYVFSVAINVMIPQLYAKELGIALGAVGLATFVVRVFDAINDQVVGILSDRTRTRFGARKPWIAAGTVVTLFSCYYLFIPPSNAGIGYFILWRAVYDIGWTMTQVAYTAWAAELTTDYTERSRLNGYAGVASNLGSFFKNVAPVALFFLGMTESSAFSLKQFEYLFYICLVIVPVITSISLWATPLGEVQVTGARPTLRSVITSVRDNRPFWRFLMAFLVMSVGQGILTLLFTFYDNYLDVGPWYPYMMMAWGFMSMIAIPIWVRLCDVMGKHRAYVLAMFINVGAIQCFWFVEPATLSQTTVGIIASSVLLVAAFGAACTFVAPPAILADIVDYGRWKNGLAQAGSYFALYALVIKLALALGSGMGFMMLDFVGYDVRPGAVNDDFAIYGLLVTILLIPAVLKGLGALMLFGFPIDRRRHGLLARRLDARAAREAARSQEAATVTT